MRVLSLFLLLVIHLQALESIFTAEEKQWIQAHPIISYVGDPSWLPYEGHNKQGKYIGICGQAPSDYPEITEFLVENGIDSISLNPDSVLKMRQVVVELEKRL